MSDELIENLRAALEESPQNIPLRLSLARLLAQGHKYQEAEAQYRAGLEHRPENPDLRTGLANVFYRLGKHSAALVICEDLIAKQTASSQTYLVAARAFAAEESYSKSSELYRQAQALNPELNDPKLEELIHGLPGIQTDGLERELAGGFDIETSFEFEPEVERPRLSFADVGGMEQLKEEIRLKIIHPLTHPEVYAAYGKKAGGGILMYGPPGCGKTHIARATAGEVKAKFINVGISDVLGQYVGQSENNLHDIFASARASRPAVLFFDEVDALAASRRDMRQSASKQVINQFLSELDGVDANNDGLLIMAATNAPWHLDGAFRRPGRFDRILFVAPPDAEARRSILEVMLSDKPAGDVDAQKLAQKTKDFSGADLMALIDLVVEDKLRSALKTGLPEPLSTKDFLKMLKSAKSSTKEWFQAARNHALYANSGGLYDDVLKHLGIDK
jgi:transitional endoplasmic reticulum ATPase